MEHFIICANDIAVGGLTAQVSFVSRNVNQEGKSLLLNSKEGTIQ